MESIMLIGFLSFLFSICYLVFHLIKRIFSPGKRFSRKLFYPCFAGGLLLLIISAPYYDEETYAADETKTEDLTTELQELKTEHSTLQKEQTVLKQQVKQANKKLKAVKAENDTLKKENEKLTKEKDSLTKKTKSLTEKLAKAEEKSSSAETSVKEKNATAQAGTSHSSPVAKNSSAESKQECKIKGSVNHIYHTPGSTYYDRTKNVTRWFCTEQEARDAGYRPPKR
ncbi:hypothetical protein MOD25_09760 [Bacillus haynesii]|uniref:coiled-coil domain-containing protein n=1 Tax=Bacillus haynesii TaxID=1925021 RepID=UPI0022811836|nr:hypothetical protein [Bacillus haynesii]MCY8550169.1 hypothetical protein [Bacillus haynesii]MCY9182910.1 hypothetical protein [Bacillus haynesii]